LDQKFAIIALTETWLYVSDNDNFEIPGYKSAKLVRRNKIGGGICIFSRDDLKLNYRMTLFLRITQVKWRLYLLK